MEETKDDLITPKTKKESINTLSFSTPNENRNYKSKSLVEEKPNAAEEDSGGWIKRRRHHSLQLSHHHHHHTNKDVEQHLNDKEINMKKSYNKCTDKNVKVTPKTNNNITKEMNTNNSKIELNAIIKEKRKQVCKNESVVEVKRPREHYETKIHHTLKISSGIKTATTNRHQIPFINTERNNQNEKKTINKENIIIRSNRKDINESSVHLQKLKWTKEVPKWEIRPNDVEYIEVNSLQVCGRNFNRLFGPMSMIFDHKKLSHMDYYKEVTLI